MLRQLAQFAKCLYCIWPAVVIFIAWKFPWAAAENRTHFGALPVGVNPLDPEGQKEFETRRERDKEKRRIIYWTIGIIVAGYLASLLWSSSTVQALVTHKGTPPEATQATVTLEPLQGLLETPTPTDLVVYIEQVVTVEVTRVVTSTSTQ